MKWLSDRYKDPVFWIALFVYGAISQYFRYVHVEPRLVEDAFIVTKWFIFIYAAIWVCIKLAKWIWKKAKEPCKCYGCETDDICEGSVW